MATTETGRIGVRRVVRDPEIMFGEPTIVGSRVPVSTIVVAAQGGDGLDGILKGYPHLTPEGIADAFAFYVQNREEIDQIIAEFESD